MPGDWALSWNPSLDHDLFARGLRALETTPNEKFQLGVQLTWQEVERPAVVLFGDYQPAPGRQPAPEKDHGLEQSDGAIQIPARRSDISATTGTSRKFLRSLGEVLMLPFVDETSTQPQEGLLWAYSGTPRQDHEPLPAATQADILAGLLRLIGWSASIEARSFELLELQPAP